MALISSQLGFRHQNLYREGERARQDANGALWFLRLKVLVFIEPPTYGERVEDWDVEMEDEFHVLDVDLDFEFDAARFFDFTRPETYSEAEEAELWFESAPSYPHIRREFHNDMAQISKVKRKPVGKPFKLRSSTLMNPTVSHLAKLNRPREVHTSQSLGRYRKGLNKIDERSSRNHLGSGSDLTKRQKLENGYVCKMLNEQDSKSILRNGTAETGRVNWEGVHNHGRCETLKSVKARPLTKKVN